METKTDTDKRIYAAVDIDRPKKTQIHRVTGNRKEVAKLCVAATS